MTATENIKSDHLPLNSNDYDDFNVDDNQHTDLRTKLTDGSGGLTLCVHFICGYYFVWQCAFDFYIIRSFVVL